ncbi:hypothetical protein GUJ93_ZPchr0013g37883 [Zizania palustris]|uniref:Uncharacterized protein n=1 Tax=Zizania palustris TaxID=103762 RepID=A0A8J6BYF9_ZIZPA|nr:hypothetical protein GUJ93_ZPchr0013g37883 [Zizania palustris]
MRVPSSPENGNLPPKGRGRAASARPSIPFPPGGAMQGGISGFQNAPVTRAVVLASGLLSVVFSTQRRVHALGLSYQKHFMSIAAAAAKGF